VNAGIVAHVRSPVPTPYGLAGATTPVPMPGIPLHPEALDWLSRVRANGGDASLAVVSAVSTFCDRIDACGLRSLLWRVNPMCGGSILAALVPLYRSTTPFGTVTGNAADTNDNFLSSDYVPQSGLLGNGSNKRLLTGVPLNFSTSRHLGAYVFSLSTIAFRSYVAAAGSVAHDGTLSLQCDSPTTTYRMENLRTTADGQGAGGGTSGIHTNGDFVLGSSPGSNVNGTSAIYRNGTFNGIAGVGNQPGLVSTGLAIFALQLSTGSFTQHTNARIGGYSIGGHLNAQQAGTYAAIWDSLMRSLARK
jgi:hypothetical protein